jgi:hypothetical protein
MSGVESGVVVGGGRRSSEWIDKEAQLRQFGNPRKQIIRQDANIGSTSPDDRSQHETINRAVRMIRRHDQWSF